MKWEHRCNINWLIKRQGYLTASDIKNLLPITKTERKREVTDLDYLKVMSSKMVTITDEDCISYGAAARGHLLEPYAVEAFNETLNAIDSYGTAEQFYWWDDELITMPGRLIAFSPDALNVPYGSPVESITSLVEIKSYGADKHLSTAYTPKDQIEERWQIACAMALLPNIEHAYLVLFNPKIKFRKLFFIKFTREELEEEIAMIKEIEKSWKEFREKGPLTKAPDNGAFYSHYGKSEDTIMKEIDQRQRLNP